MKRIVVTAKDVKGTCIAGIKPGSKFVIERNNILLKESDVVCPVALTHMYYRIYALQKGANVRRTIGCPDGFIWGSDFGQGSVLFEINVEEK
ncbi:TIGR04076 family protein [Candidatus Bathyarchaeota archaeon]|nr:TIGR04076 family protein [Candidatus Bathyarchaeota archaeon]